MTLQRYLILIRNSRLALTVGAALEDRLLRDGLHASAVVIGPGEKGWDAQVHDLCRGGRAAPEPLVVALYEDGLLRALASLGLAAYVGVPEEVGRQVVNWENGLGAIMLPVASARDLVGAIATHTPWSAFAQAHVPADADLPSAFVSRYPSRQTRTSSSRPAGPLSLSRKLALAGMAAPLLVASPAAAAATVAHTGTGSVSRRADPADISVVTTSFVRMSQADQASGGRAPAGQGAAPVTNSQANSGSWWPNASYYWQGTVNALPNASYYMVEGGKIGAAGGAVVGAIGGGILGAAGGTTLEPGGGTAAGWYAGAYSGAKAGGVLGGVVGAATGFMYGFATSPTWSTTPGTQGNSVGTTNATMNAQGTTTDAQGTTTSGPVSGPQGSQSGNADGTTRSASGSQGGKSPDAGTTSPGPAGTSSGTGTTSSGTGTTSSGTGTTSSGTGGTSAAAGSTSSGAGSTSSGTTGSTSNGSSSGGGPSGGTSGGGGASSGGGTS